jgi:hypothetical protein
MAGVIHVERTDNYLDAAGTLRLDYLATLRGRVGYAWDRNLIYLTGGPAAGHLKLTFNQYHPGGPASPPFQTSVEATHYGFALGGGWQWAFLDNALLNRISLGRSSRARLHLPTRGGLHRRQFRKRWLGRSCGEGRRELAAALTPAPAGTFRVSDCAIERVRAIVIEATFKCSIEPRMQRTIRGL